MPLSELWSRLCRPRDGPQPLLDQDLEDQENDGDHYQDSGDSDHPPLQDRCSGGDSDSGKSRQDGSSENEDMNPRPEDSDSSSSSGSDSSSSSASSSSSSTPSLKRRRRRQTQKAREAGKENRIIRKVVQQLDIQIPENGSEYIPELQGEGFITGPGQHKKEHSRKRLRLVYSWVKSVVTFLNSFFSSQPCQHVFTISVIDDTNAELSTTVAPGWYSSRTVTVLNNVQTCVACFDSGCAEKPGQQYRAFPLHTPPVCLHRANAPGVLQQFQSWLLSKPGSRWEKFGLNPDLLANVPVVCNIMCFDSLSTNIRLLKFLRHAAFRKRKQAEEAPQDRDNVQVHPLTGIVCSIHQLALARRSLLFHHSGFWSSIVRLGHLFGTHNFRLQFRAAIFAVICDHFQYIPAQSMPQQHSEWKKDRDRLCHQAPEDARKSRHSWHRVLSKFDNGPITSPKFTHWCLGDCCRGRSPAEKSDFCLQMMCRYYYLIFCFGYSVPLTYRWKHAQPALRYCQDSCLECPMTDHDHGPF